MKTINFENLEIKSLSGRIERINVKEPLAELIYAQFGGLGYKLLAEKIYKSDGGCELNEKECKLLSAVVSPNADFLANKYADAIREKLNVEQ